MVCYFFLYLFQWGELYYRRDGNDTPKSLAPEVAELQDLFAEVKRRHQENHRLWRHDLTKYLLRMEEMSPNPLTLSEEYQRIRDSFEIPFETVDYQNWVNFTSTSSIIQHLLLFIVRFISVEIRIRIRITILCSC